MGRCRTPAPDAMTCICIPLSTGGFKATALQLTKENVSPAEVVEVFPGPRQNGKYASLLT
jgi:hypothetical protein